ncbi:MAG TPA: non-ribosomal peptide synthetase, partial [Micromonosporaceae bacterium]
MNDQPRPWPDFARLHGGDGRHGEAVCGATITEAFAAQVARHPDRPAVLADDAGVTYRDLGRAVVATAAGLPAGDGPVGVLCQHGVTTITALLAALAAGSAYVPLDPVFPAQRLATILADAGVRAVLADGAHTDLARSLADLAARPDLPIVPVRLSTSDGLGAEVDLAALHGAARADDPAYVLYTSGSTGTPKGVVQSHRNVLFGVTNHVRNFAIGPDDRTSVLTSFGYDMAVTDTFSALACGAAAVPVDVRTHGLGHLAGALAERGVTVYHSTPTVYRYLVASLGERGRLSSVRAVLLGGEEVTRHDVTLARRHFAPGAVFVNGYGTTEISFATQYHLSADAELDQAVVPIGYPLPGIDIVLVDPAGASSDTGEIVVRTPHVSLGYLGLPELTAARFGEHDGVPTYRTGDVGRRLPDGRLVYLGRADRMVKIRGYRVELGEVEAQLAALPAVARAAVVARPVRAGDRAAEREIIGYVVPASPEAADPDSLRKALVRVLPAFMVPRVLVIVADLPIGPTGKLDHAALPEPPTATASNGTGAAGLASSLVDGELERAIAACWCEVLELPSVSRQANFFALGGHSLQLALVQQRLERRLGRRVPLARMVEFPTVAGLAAYLGTGRADEPELASV